MGRWSVAWVLGCASFLTAASAQAGPREHVLPERVADRAARHASWTTSGHWTTSPPIQPDDAGTRVAAIASVLDGRHVELQARGLGVDERGTCSTDATGPWTSMQETFTGGELRVSVVDLAEGYPCAQIRMRADADVAVGDLQWELLEPRYPDAGRSSRSLTSQPDSTNAIPSELETIGVISREDWGARATQCTSPEDEWYRMAIHHTAGPLTADGSVEERLRGTQAYAMDSGGFCDIPYQMLVGFDGTLYEGRGLELLSGATGGGNNPGNLAVCFIGCFHQPDSDCVGGEGHEPTEEMMQRGQLLVQTLVRLFDIPTDEDTIRGHRDWPGNSTACPGSLLHPRLGELRADTTWFSATEVERSWDEASEVEVVLGQSTEIWVELENTGGLPWTPGITFLAPTNPRDSESSLYDSSWPSENRAATVEVEVQPGEVGRFSVTVSVDSEGPFTQTFGLVHEATTWFADPPWGGGPSDDAVTLTVRGVSEVGTTGGPSGSSGGTTGEPGGGTAADPPGGSESGVGSSGEGTGGVALPPADDGDDGGCGCGSNRGGGPLALLSVLALVGLRRRR